MGCDIHFYVEKKVNEKWETADKWNKYDDDDYEEGDLTVNYEDRFYHNRNYDLFAILADVRNGRGFAGICTGDGFIPISAPKGLPDDICDQVKKEADRWEGDAHSHSHFLLSELISYDYKGQTTKHRGWVDSKNYRIFIEKGKPSSWCAALSIRTNHYSSDISSVPTFIRRSRVSQRK